MDSLPKEIDAVQKDTLHRFYFGFPMDKGHDERGAGMYLDSDQESTRASYMAALGVLNRLRTRLLGEATYLTTAGVVDVVNKDIVDELSQGLDCQSSEPQRVVRALARQGIILAIPDHDRWLYPSFQFEDGRISPFMQKVHNHFRNIAGDREPDRWHQLDFFLGHYKKLGNQAIASCLWDEEKAGAIRFIINDTRI